LNDISVCSEEHLHPFIVSSVHFLDADPSLRDEVLGLKPDASKHETFLDIEPVRDLFLNFHALHLTIVRYRCTVIVMYRWFYDNKR